VDPSCHPKITLMDIPSQRPRECGFQLLEILPITAHGTVEPPAIAVDKRKYQVVQPLAALLNPREALVSGSITLAVTHEHQNLNRCSGTRPGPPL